MDPVMTAVQATVHQCCADLCEAVRGLDAEALAWAPAADTSSLAVLVRHSTSSTRNWLRAAATGHMDRDRYLREERAPAFDNRPADEAELLGVIDALETEARNLLPSVPAERLRETLTYTGQAHDEPRTRAWALLHAVEHLREHVGHAQLTRQLMRDT